MLNFEVLVVLCRLVRPLFNFLCFFVSRVDFFLYRRSSSTDPQPLLIFRTAVVDCLLQQVIPRKDLPRIYTMCLPVKDRDGGFYAKDDLGEGDLSLSSGLQDLEVRACVRAIMSTDRALSVGVDSPAIDITLTGLRVARKTTSSAPLGITCHHHRIIGVWRSLEQVQFLSRARTRAYLVPGIYYQVYTWYLL